MNEQIVLHNYIKKEMERYKSLHDKMLFAQKRLPKGSLSERDGRLIHSIRDKGVQFAITLSEDDPVVNEIKFRRYIKEGLPVLKKKIDNCDMFLKNDLIYDPFSLEAELNNCYHGIVNLDVFLQGDVTAEQLDEINVHKNPAPFREMHYTSEMVECRSKSEALWGTRLEQRGFKYWYDTALRLYDGSVIYTDFKIYLPRRRMIAMLEHFGMIDNAVYAESCMRRLEKYARSGFYLGWNLFCTYETREKPLTMKIIDEKLDEIESLDRI